MVGDAGWGLLLPFRVGQGLGGLGGHCTARMAQWLRGSDEGNLSMSMSVGEWE